ncbi:hypothetical protein OG946_20205 [Streptomyces sp. NBC_01808]|nr:hypothetical protein [Streptomyces sp. NBC_01808]WSA39479.1 hypothetical protein OG946_20205 [Streptomyces sp. NBC_01808]
MTESLGALSAVLTALILVALAHPDAQLRATAERLLRIIFRTE